jgi:DNA-binding HxlR family transcriptional regulator
MDWTRIRTLQELISGRWEPAILMILRQGPMRSARLRQAISPRLSYQVFSRTVRSLQGKGFIERVEGNGPGLRMKVTYRLTDEGNVIVGLLAQVDDWALIHSGDLPTTHPAGALPAPGPVQDAPTTAGGDGPEPLRPTPGPLDPPCPGEGAAS